MHQDLAILMVISTLGSSDELAVNYAPGSGGLDAPGSGGLDASGSGG